jgi:integrase
VDHHRAAWWLDVRINGIRHRIKLGPLKLLEKRRAREIADMKIKELLAPKPPEQKGTVPFTEFAKKFLARAVETKRSWAQYIEHPGDASKTTIAMERTPLCHAVGFFGNTLLKDISTDRIEDFRSHLLNRKVGRRRMKPASANRYISLLRHVLNCAVRWGDLNSNPAAGVNMLAEAPMPERVLSDAEQTALLDAMPDWLRRLTTFVLQTALRRGDVIGLTWAAVQGGSTLELVETKEGKRRHVPLNSTSKSILSVLMAGRKTKPTDYIFEPQLARSVLKWKLRRAWRRAVKASGIQPIRFHDMRHTALSRLVELGADVRTVQAIAGHSSLKTTQRYLHSSDRQKQAAVELLDKGHRLPTTGVHNVSDLHVSGIIQ